MNYERGHDSNTALRRHVQAPSLDHASCRGASGLVPPVEWAVGSNKTKRIVLERAGAFRFVKDPDKLYGCEQAVGACKEDVILPKSLVHEQLYLKDDSRSVPPRHELG